MIPRIFHRIWLDEPIENCPDNLFWEEFQKLHPNWEFRTWNNSEDILSFAVNKEQLKQSLLMGKAGLALSSDIARYEIVAKIGGIYVDTDVEPLKSFEPLIEDEQPFMGWEDDERLCPTVLGSPPGHPAMVDLIMNLPKNMKQGLSPVAQTGPAYVTKRWIFRDDVRRLAPMFFYPVHYSQKHLLGLPYPEESYAVHHWRAGWKTNMKTNTETKVQNLDKSVSLIVPYRSDSGGPRDQVWSWLKPRWEQNFPDWEIVLGEDAIATSGEDFSRAAAINNGVSKSHGKILVIADNDVWMMPGLLKRAVSSVRDWVLPWTTMLRIDEKLTKEILSKPPLGTQLTARLLGDNFEDKSSHWGGLIIVTRHAFDTVGGLDERFRGWGGEDTMLQCVLVSKFGVRKKGNQNLIHLWHPRPIIDGKPVLKGKIGRNVALLERYQDARNLTLLGNHTKIDQLMQEVRDKI